VQLTIAAVSVITHLFQQPLQIPQMGFSDHSIHNVSLVPDTYLNSRAKDEKDSAESDKANESATRLSDQEVLEEVEAIYFTENVDSGVYELKVCQLDVNRSHGNYKQFLFL
jgi:hypothetical protein